MTLTLAENLEFRQWPPADFDWEHFLRTDLVMYSNQRIAEFQIRGLAGDVDTSLAMRAFAAHHTSEMIKLYGHLRSLKSDPDELPRWMDFTALPFTATGAVLGCSGKALHLAKTQLAAFRLGFYGSSVLGSPALQFILRLFADYLGDAQMTLRGDAASHPIYNALMETWRCPRGGADARLVGRL
jgi:hypothetical protein